MRFLHTSDWHLGRIFHGRSLLEDQTHALTELLSIAKESNLDALVIAGDIYDRAVPPVEAVELLDWFLSEAVLGMKLPTLMISGNHDSPERLGFGSRLLLSQHLHVCSDFTFAAEPLTLNDAFGPVHFYGLPYVDPPRIATAFAVQGLPNHEAALELCLNQIREAHPLQERSVLVAHAFVEGGSVSDSERPLSIGGSGTVPSRLFEMFSYTALGHLHRPQSVGKKTIQYSGSLLKYSFSEMGHGKSVNLVDIEADGEVNCQRIALTPKRELREIRGTLSHLLDAASQDLNPDDYLLVTLEDSGPVLDPLGKLRPFYPNILHVERTALRQGPEVQSTLARRAKQSEKEIYASFFRDVTGEEMTDCQQDALKSITERWHEGEIGR